RGARLPLRGERPARAQQLPRGRVRDPRRLRAETARPDPTDEGRMSATELLQIISESGRAVPGSEPRLKPSRMVELYQAMLRTRLLDERMLNLQRQGRIGFYVPSTGEEASQVGTAACVGKNDWVYPSYRAPGLLMMCGAPLDQMVSNCFGNSDDLCKGR